MRTFRGADLWTAESWVVIQRSNDGQNWWPKTYTIAGTRSGAIRKYDALWEGIPNAYRRARRRGDALAVHCLVEPLTFGGRP